jgi:hypothetical protein
VLKILVEPSQIVLCMIHGLHLFECPTSLFIRIHFVSERAWCCVVFFVL